MLPLCVLQLKVLREHQVNIHWLASTVRNLISMSSGCLFTVSCSALPMHTPTHMNKVQAHTLKHVHAAQTSTHEIHSPTQMYTQEKIPVHTHACTHAYMLPSQPS